MINRLGLVIHWLGFLALIDFVGLLVDAIAIFHGAGVIEEISRVLFNPNQNFRDMEGWFFLSFWIAVIHWPIKVVLTRSKSFFPWSKR